MTNFLKLLAAAAFLAHIAVLAGHPEFAPAADLIHQFSTAAGEVARQTRLQAPNSAARVAAAMSRRS